MHERRYKAEIGFLRSPSRVRLMEIERVVELCVQAFAARNVLDVGTGTGLFAQAFAVRGLEVTGIDTNPKTVEVAQRYVPRGYFRLAPAEAIPFPEKSFDLVFMGLVLHETDEPLLALKEARRVAMLGVAVLEWPYQEEEHGPPLAHRMKPEEVEALTREAGFGKVEILYLAHMVLYRLRR